jgi:putative ABC transport system permease protein
MFTYAARTLRKSPALTITAMFTIALGIGASTAIFSVVNAVLLRPLPYSDPQRLAIIWGDMRARGVTDWPFSGPDFDDLRREATLFDGTAGVFTGRAIVPNETGDSEMIRTGVVTPNFFRVMGARVVLGRDFTDADAVPQPRPPQQQPGQPQAAPPPRLPVIAVLTHNYWLKRFAADPNVVGRSIDFGNGKAQIIGVLEPGFELLFPPKANLERNPEVWTAMRVDFAAENRNNVYLRVVGRVKPGVTFERAQGQVDSIAAELRRRFPIKTTAGLYLRVEPMHKNVVAQVRTAILALMGAVIFLLLIVCANVANLLLLRAAGRSRELAIRAALGSGRWNLVRQMLAETLLLAGGGALLGLGLARLGIDLLIALGPTNLPRLDAVAIDPRVLGFAALATLCAAGTFGLMPAFRASRPDVMELLRASGRTAGLGSGRVFRSFVVVTEVALSFVLLIGSGLMLRSFLTLQRTDPGFEPRGLLTFLLPINTARSAEEAAAKHRDLRARFRAIPGVTGVTASSSLPLDGSTPLARWGTEDALSDPNKFRQANVKFVLPDYFETMRTRFIEGRTFSDADTNNRDARITVIDQVMAAKAFPRQPAVGKRLLGRVNTDEAVWYEVIGVVAHQRHDSLAEEGREAMFLPAFPARWAIRTAGDPTSLIPLVRAEISKVDRRLAISEVLPMNTYVDRAQAQTRFALILIGVFAAIAVILAAVGLYGVLSDAVRQRTAEIGLRMALGAAPMTIFQLVVGQGLRLSAAGIAIGIAAALVLTRLMSTMLIGVTPHDTATFIGIAVLFFGIAAVACWLPARRAAGLDPTAALREE